MNKQKPPKAIEWTRIREHLPDGTVNIRDGYTWNPTAGCLHGCTWQMPDGNVTQCYAKTVAEKFTAAYPQGFEHHYFHPDRLNEPLKLKKPAGIFVGSMADLFGHWVPDEQLFDVLSIIEQARHHIFQTLSKNPLRIADFCQRVSDSSYPSNMWTGVSVPAGHMMKPEGAAKALKSYLKWMEYIRADVRFMSIEPLWFDVAPVFEQYVDEHGKLPMEWVIIGAASNGAKLYQPDAGWVARLLKVLDSQNIPIFFKGNLEWREWHDDFPKVTDRYVHI